MIKKCYILLVVGALSLFFNISTTVHAQDNIGFSVSPVITGTQLDFSKGFFYVQTKPGEKQELVVKVTSMQEEPIDINISIDNAISQESGIIGFQEPVIKSDTLKNPISEILTTKEKKITVEGYETKDVVFELTPPAEHYDGIKWGIMTFNSKDNKEKVNSLVSVSNQYRVGIITSENGEPYNDGQNLNLKEVRANLNRGRKVIEAAVENPDPKTVEDLEIDAKLLDKKSGKIIKESKVNNYAFAPNSIMPFVFDWGLSNLVAGEYILKMDISNNDNEWHLEEPFKLTENQVKKVNDQSPIKITTPTWMKVTTIVLGTYVVIVSVILKIRQNKWKKIVTRNKKRKNRKRGSNR
ncbi:DUF3324 domain-containing protein [uncultured Vagococcus sp.]|uniref:DUF3324 domain-containing protein n=1 Tax=uncultured Vagococcus sp. TaxID=189676 RepID=UPI00258391AB|nr:DUF3324 domain-containing protein [uncultured Vagococcus sp.]